MTLREIKAQGYCKYYKPVVDPNKTDDNVCENESFSNLLHFIGENIPYRDRAPIPSAYVVIRQETDKLLRLPARYWYLKTSKREVASMRFVFSPILTSIQGEERFVKIPYKTLFIFEAIVSLLKKIKESGVVLPENLKEFVGKTYLEAFYQTHADAFLYSFQGRQEELVGVFATLNNDLNDEESPLQKQFI